MIRVENTGTDTYQVTVESAATTQHSVTVTPEYWQKLTGGRVSVETLIEKSLNSCSSAKETPASCAPSICRSFSDIFLSSRARSARGGVKSAL
jgi:hypothetical protein